ncbi:MAG: hypothetical protein LBS59_03785 [Puniceicoccales bacterium]|jgi:hypothetical protein|nr:hypothetical protein [Puniceicoccales bacterium]
MPEYKNIALSVKSAADEMRKICANAPEGRLRRHLDEVSQLLTNTHLEFLQQCLTENESPETIFANLKTNLIDVSSRLRRFQDTTDNILAPPNFTPLLLQLAEIQLALLQEPPAPTQKNENPPASDGFDIKNFEPYQLPSGVTIYTKYEKDGSVSEYYYCPNCLQKKRVNALEFKFGDIKKYLCLRCASSFYVDTPPPKPDLLAPPETPLQPPSPPIHPPPPATMTPATITTTPTPEAAPPSPPPTENAQPRLKLTREVTRKTTADAPPPPEIRAVQHKVKPHASYFDRVHGKELPETDVETDASPQKIRWARWKKNFGGNGFAVSIAIHLLLLLSLLLIVLPSPPPKEEENFVFSTGSGGGKDGEKITFREHKIQHRHSKEFARARDKLSIKSPASKVNISDTTMPEMRALMPHSLQAMLSKGSGDGLGGGTGGLTGLGSGGRNFTSRMVMGLRINAKNMAVYLDNSGSMSPYLEPVKAEIYKQFPNADIYEYDGIRIRVVDGSIENGRPPANSIFNAKGGHGSRKEIIDRYGANFTASSVGAWIDIMLHEGYDTLIVFSDFQDGVEQSSAGTRVFVETPHENFDRRDATDKQWEKQWLTRFSNLNGGPRLYLFSIEVQPQTIWQQCVKTSRGAIRMRPDLHHSPR